MTSSVVALVSVLSFLSGVVLAYEGKAIRGTPVPVPVAARLFGSSVRPPTAPAGKELAPPAVMPPDVMQLADVLIIGDRAAPPLAPAASARP